MPWVRLLKENGYEVFAIAPSGAWNKQIEAGGAKYVDWQLSRSGRNPISEIRSIFTLIQILRKIKPDIVQNFHTKPNIYVPIAAKFAGVRLSVSTVTGLGYTFVEKSGIGSYLAKRLNLSMYALSNRLAHQVTFQNPDDLSLLRANGALTKTKGQFITGGSGVDLDEYSPNTRDDSESQNLRRSLSINQDAFVVMFVGRLQTDKGLYEFVEAARILKQRKNLVFIMVGAPDPGNKRTLSQSTLSRWESEKNVIFTGRREDVPKLMAMANIIVTPTFYREGLPRTLLEAAATGLPLIGTDTPGVREAISDGVNGTLIPIRDSTTLADAIEDLANDPAKCKRYGEASLKRANNEFDHRRVIGKYMTMYKELWRQL